LNISERNFT